MAVKSIDEVLDEVKSPKLKKILTDSKEEHDRLKSEIYELLEKSDIEGKEPSPIAAAMSWMKINVKMMTDKSDRTIAELMSEGCSMGIRSLCKYRNEYGNVQKEISDITNRLIAVSYTHLDVYKRQSMYSQFFRSSYRQYFCIRL